MLSELKITDLQCTASEKRYLINLSGCYFEANESTVQLLVAIRNAGSLELGIRNFVNSHKEYPYEHIREIVYTKLIPKLKVEGASRRQFLYHCTLISAENITNISSRLKFLFKPYVMIGLSVAGIFAILYFFLSNKQLTVFTGRIDAILILMLLLFVLGSSFFHELGHAAATRYYGLRHGDIGFGLYLSFPVLYTDVSSIWQLPVCQRCVVNVAGVYFQIILLTPLIILYAFTGNEPIKYMVLTMCFGFLLTLNPFFKFDGYWLATDLLGVPNLRRRTGELLTYYLSLLFHRTATRPQMLSTKGFIRVLIIAYSVAVNLFMCYYFFYIIPSFLHGFFGNFPMEIRELIICLSNHLMPPFALIRNIFSQLIFCGLIIYMIYRIVGFRLCKLVKKYVIQSHR